MTTEIKISELEKLPRPELCALAMFSLGVDLQKVYNPQTVHRLKKSLAKYGYDISRQIEQRTIYTKSLELASNRYI